MNDDLSSPSEAAIIIQKRGQIWGEDRKWMISVQGYVNGFLSQIGLRSYEDMRTDLLVWYIQTCCLLEERSSCCTLFWFTHPRECCSMVGLMQQLGGGLDPTNNHPLGFQNLCLLLLMSKFITGARISIYEESVSFSGEFMTILAAVLRCRLCCLRDIYAREARR